MTLKEIVTAVDAGKTVHWCTTDYHVTLDRSVGRYYIKCTSTRTTAELIQRGNLTGQEAEFFLA